MPNTSTNKTYSQKFINKIHASSMRMCMRMHMSVRVSECVSDCLPNMKAFPASSTMRYGHGSLSTPRLDMVAVVIEVVAGQGQGFL
jgi:hypothetical protein